MVAEHDSGAAFLARHTIENPAAQARTKRTIGFVFRQFVRDDGICVLGDDPVFDAEAFQIVRQNMFGKTGLALIKIAGDKLCFQGALPFQVQKRCEQRIAVLAAGEAHQPFLRAAIPAAVTARAIHAETPDSFLGLAQETLSELLERDRRGRMRVSGRQPAGAIFCFLVKGGAVGHESASLLGRSLKP